MSFLRSPLPDESRHEDLKRHAWRLAVALALAALALVLSGAATAAPPEVRPPDEVRTAPGQFIVVAVANPVTGRPAAVGGTAHGYGSTTNYRVSATASALIHELARKHSLTLVSEWPIEQLQMHCVLFRIPPGTTREAVIEKLLADKRVLIAQPLNEFESASAATPAFDDPYARLQSNVSALDVAEAHHFSRGAGVRVAIIDTGVDTGHPDLAGRTELTRNYIDGDDSAFRSDRHGTQVAGLIAASANNGIGIVGVAPDVRLMAYKACWQPSPSSSGRCNSFTVAQALADALAARAHVINLSLVGPSDPLLEALVARAIQAGVIVVGAVSDDPRMAFPAKLPSVLPVAEAEDARNDEPNVLRAPARDILTLVPNGHYDFASGSSLATAQVTGVVALLLAKNQKLGADRLRALLAQSTEKHDTTRGPFLSVNACAALAQLVHGAVCAQR
ncbi:MAG TPA: S8 family serine peptidase [Steroidobacteraceae bacterium]|jgi:subtilisin family serine protease|nr:S8 family serine peptidase [Steroidobacteraceae bacterium]